MNSSTYQRFTRLFEARAAAHPDRVAVMFRGTPMTYGELDARAEGIARQLRSLGVVRNDLVGLHVERSVGMLAAMLGIHKAGGAYVPLDTAFPRERLDHIVEDAQLRYLIHHGAIKLSVPPVHCIDLAIEPATAAVAAAVVEAGEDDPRDLAYVMYTSGSTGKPKGVKVHHGAVLNFLRSMQQTPGLDESDVLVAVTTPSFDISVLELFLPLVTGARIALASKEETMDGQQLAELIRASGATVMQATPATWRMLFLADWKGAPKLKVLCGGEMLDNPLAQKICGVTASLWNMYGPTETTVWSTCCQIKDPAAPISVGYPILNTTVHVLDEAMRPLPAGSSGELYIGGDGVTLGYTQEALTTARFVRDVFSDDPQARLYRTGDVASFNTDGSLQIVGRMDEQVKVRGFRIELNDVQKHMLECPGVEQGAVVCRRDPLGENQLVAFIVTQAPGSADQRSIKAFLTTRLPEYMVPSSVFTLDSLPLTPNGKVDKKVLATAAFEDDGDSGDVSQTEADATDLRAMLTAIVARLVKLHDVDPDANLFDLGIDSLQANYIAATLSKRARCRVSVGDLFEHPTVNSFLAHQDDKLYLEKVRESARARMALRQRKGAAGADGEAIAIIGMAGRFPGANTIDEFWTVLSEGLDTVTRFTPEEDDPAVDVQDRENPNYIRARGMIKNPEMFDASFFGVSPNEAAVMDPQQRVFLEIAWEAMENAGYDPDRFEGLFGVYAGMGNNFYYYHNVSTRPNLIRMVGEVQVEIGREKDHIATLVSHKLNLTGPSVSVHTACSTGLVCIDNACQSLLSYQCDAAVAGAIELRTPQMSGQMHEPSGIFTGDGRCRPFSDNASGTMFSDSAGVVVLKRLSDAIADHDNILAVIRGSAVNHDGLGKKSYLAPSVKGQMEVIATAQARARILPSSVTYMEAHGTATPVGDPIEFQALRNVFELDSKQKNYCALGSVKGNLGHPTTAAGAIGVIKTALALQHKKIPPLVNFNAINPNIDIENSPFYINTQLIDWAPGNNARRAGISSFGFCGTNAHVVIEESPEVPRAAGRPARPWLPVLLSAATETALKELTERVGAAFAADAAPRPVDAAFTLAVGRKRLKQRRFALCDITRPGQFEEISAPRKAASNATPELSFLFPGQGAQYLGMGHDLYQTEPAFKAAFDRCADLLLPHLGEDLRRLVMGIGAEADDKAEREAKLNSTHITQPAMFCIEYSLATLWMSWGVQPAVLCGHSIGEYVCAVLAGVFSLEDGIRIIAARGRLMGALPRGVMLSVRLAQQDLAADLEGTRLSVAAINSPSLCVVAGPAEEIDALMAKLDARAVRCQKLHTSHAFHSWMMEPAVQPFLDIVREVRLSAPRIQIVSTVTGLELTAAQAQDPNYWASHITRPVNFSAAIKTLWDQENRVILEIGPRGSMSSLAMTQAVHKGKQVAIPSLADSSEDHAECRALARAIGQLWVNRVEVDWNAYFQDDVAYRVPLPTYPFERKRYWVEPANVRTATPTATDTTSQPMGDTEEAAAADPDTASQRIVKELRTILEEVSGENMQEADLSATFFELGLDSLLLTPITYMVKERFAVTITFRQLLRDLSSLGALSAHLLAQMPARSGAAASPAATAAQTEAPASPVATLRAIPTTVAQRAMLAAEAADAQAGLAHLESVAIEFAGVPRKESLEAAIESLCDAHDMLRASFVADGSAAHAEARSRPEIRWVDTDANGVQATIDAEMRRPFDLASAPLVRFSVLRIDAQRQMLVMTAHSAVCDRWSIDVLIEELAHAYSQHVETGSVAPPVAEQFVDYAAREAAFLASPRAQAQQAHWALELAGAPRAPEFKGAAASSQDAGGELAHAAFVVDAPTLAALKDASANWRCSLFNTLFGALHVVLHRHVAGGSVVVATPFAGQSAANMPRLIGACTNLLPIRTANAGARPFTELLQEVQGKLIAAYENQDTLVEPVAMAFVHTQRLRAITHIFKGLEADYRFNARADQDSGVVFDVLEYDDKLMVDCTWKAGLFSSVQMAQVFADYRDQLFELAATARIAAPVAVPSPALVSELSDG
ncbi:amino acid adenylation domain-containing protein [Variovorax humicola]|uniref:Amino acid adenylation domain-containing protein n=1 Tax=Variovorax humicola TaxID=1769758 RepID=A0ABU8VSC3_9BURK